MDWPEPWGAIDNAAVASAFESELQKELSAGHPLFGLPLRAVGRRWDCDDVLFAVDDGSERVAAVHLTWARGPEEPPWPGSALYDDFADWANEARQDWLWSRRT